MVRIPVPTASSHTERIIRPTTNT